MADNAVTIEADADNAFQMINAMALGVQSRAREAAHLIAAIDESCDNLSCGGEVAGKEQTDVIDRILVFCRLAHEAALRAAEIGEQIERAAKPQRLVCGN